MDHIANEVLVHFSFCQNENLFLFLEINLIFFSVAIQKANNVCENIFFRIIDCKQQFHLRFLNKRKIAFLKQWKYVYVVNFLTSYRICVIWYWAHCLRINFSSSNCWELQSNLRICSIWYLSGECVCELCIVIKSKIFGGKTKIFWQWSKQWKYILGHTIHVQVCS